MLARAVPCVPIIITIVIVACHLQQAGRQASKQARRQPGSVRDSILQRVQLRIVSFRPRLSVHFRAGLDSGIASIVVVVLAVRARPRNAAHLAVCSLQTCISAEGRE